VTELARQGIPRGLAARRVIAVALALGALSISAAASAEGGEDVPGDGAPADRPSAADLLRRFDEMYESSGTVARMELAVTRPGKTRTMRMRTWSIGQDRALVVVEAPPRDAGTATLKVEGNLWNYLPKISRTIRVPPSMMMGSWMGTDVTNDDLVRETSWEADYTAEVTGRSDDPPGWLVRLEARPDVPGLWEAVEAVFSDAEKLPVEIRYFDRKGRLSRTMSLADVREVGGRRIPMAITVVPERKEGHRTEMRYLHVEFDADLDASVFSLAALERRR